MNESKVWNLLIERDGGTEEEEKEEEERRLRGLSAGELSMTGNGARSNGSDELMQAALVNYQAYYEAETHGCWRGGGGGIINWLRAERVMMSWWPTFQSAPWSIIVSIVQFSPLHLLSEREEGGRSGGRWRPVGEKYAKLNSDKREREISWASRAARNAKRGAFSPGNSTGNVNYINTWKKIQ